MCIGLLIQIPQISAQEGGVSPANDPTSSQEGGLLQEPSAQEPQTVEERIRAAEQAMTFEFDSFGANPVPAQGVTVWTIIRMILVLLLVAASIYGLVFLLKKASKRGADNDPFLKILANKHLGFNRYAHIVSIGSKAYLVGSSEGGVNLISEIDDKEIIDAMLLEDSRKSEAVQSRVQDFLSLLRRLGVRAQRNNPGADEIRKRRERLKGL